MNKKIILFILVLITTPRIEPNGFRKLILVSGISIITLISTIALFCSKNNQDELQEIQDDQHPNGLSKVGFVEYQSDSEGNWAELGVEPTGKGVVLTLNRISDGINKGEDWDKDIGSEDEDWDKDIGDLQPTVKLEDVLESEGSNFKGKKNSRVQSGTFRMVDGKLVFVEGNSYIRKNPDEK